MRVEIVTHCWNYARALSLQASSLLLHPPEFTTALLTVFYCDEDQRTANLIRRLIAFQKAHSVRGVEIRGWTLKKPQLMRRAIGRNMAAKETKAGLVWFADCDMLLGEKCLDNLVLEHERNIEKVLMYPRSVWACSQEDGDKIIDQVSLPWTGPTEPAEVEWFDWFYNRAIGGVQIVPGWVARAHGYLDGHPKYQQPEKIWRRTFEDTQYRKQLDKQFKSRKGQKILVREVYRVRHSERGREVPGLEL